MISEEQLREVEEMYQGEVLGEAFYCALLPLFQSPVQQRLLGSLLQLETENKARLRRIVFEYGGDVVENDATRAEARDYIQTVEHMGWAEAAATLVAASEEFRDRYRDLVETMPDALKPVVKYMIEHEDLIIAAMRLAADGEDEKAIDLVSARLMLPLPRPPAA